MKIIAYRLDRKYVFAYLHHTTRLLAVLLCEIVTRTTKFHKKHQQNQINLYSNMLVFVKTFTNILVLAITRLLGLKWTLYNLG